MIVVVVGERGGKLVMVQVVYTWEENVRDCLGLTGEGGSSRQELGVITKGPSRRHK